MPLLSPPPASRRILDRLRGAGYESYFCGGCVRDALLGAEPADWDIATAAPPAAVETLFPKTVAVGRAFGVMIVVDEGEHEVATFRSDLDYADGRRPEGVVFSSPREDALRRDFTINALFYDPDGDRILDFVGGREDLSRRLIRAVGEPRRRFAEDRLRLLRAVRFAARTGFEIEPLTLAAVREAAMHAAAVSGERTGEELTRMFAGGRARRSLELLEESGLLAVVLPEVAALRGVEQPREFHPEGDVWTHTLLLAGLFDEAAAESAYPIPPEARAGGLTPETGRAILAWAGILHDIGKPATFTVSDRIRFHDHDRLGREMAEAVLSRLKRPRALLDPVCELIGRHIHFANLRRMRKAKLRRWLQEPDFPLHLELHRLDCASSHRLLDNHAFGLEAWREEMRRPPILAPLLTGRDLIRLGVRPGPRLGEMLRAVEDARLEGEIALPAEAVEWVKEKYGIGPPRGEP